MFNYHFGIILRQCNIIKTIWNKNLLAIAMNLIKPIYQMDNFF